MYIKRIFDILFSISVLVLLLPLLLVISALIKLTSKGPVFYKWEVVGKNGRFFTGYKFRTMVENADDRKKDLQNNNEMTGPVFKISKDPRVTRLGRYLRTYSIDELPQFYSVLKGDMSVVGPRPAGQLEWPKYDDWHKRKLSVIPGITCLWQVNGRNNITSFDDWVKLDLQYIDNRSFMLDMKIILLTIYSVIRGTGR